MNRSRTRCQSAPRMQRGFLLITAVILIVTVALLATVITFLSTGNVLSSAGHANSAKALFVAESGMERALLGFKAGTACAALSSLTPPSTVGEGNFSILGTLYNPVAPVTIAVNIGTTDTVIPVSADPRTAGYATHGRLMIGTEALNYTRVATTGCSGAPACFTGVTRGVAGTAPVDPAVGDPVLQNQCLIRSTGTVNAAKRTVESAVTVGASKNVQSGSITMNPATRTVTLGTAVNPARAFVVCYNRTDISDPTNRVTCELTNATTVTLTASVASGTNVVQWYVAEFSSGMTVQRDLTAFGSCGGAACRTVNVTLPQAVNLARTFVLVTERINDTNQDRDERWTVQARLTSTTNLELARDEGNTALSVAWQVIEMNDATVQSGLASIGNGSASNTAAITAVDPARSFLVFSRRAANNVAGVEGRFQVRGELTNGTTLTFARAGTERQINIAWFVISLGDGTTVRRGTATAPGGTNTQNVALTPAVTLNRGFPIISASGGNNNDVADLDSTSWAPAFTATTNLQLQRTPAGTGTQISSSVAWFAIDFGFDPTRIDWLEVYP